MSFRAPEIKGLQRASHSRGAKIHDTSQRVLSCWAGRCRDNKKRYVPYDGRGRNKQERAEEAEDGVMQKKEDERKCYFFRPGRTTPWQKRIREPWKCRCNLKFVLRLSKWKAEAGRNGTPCRPPRARGRARGLGTCAHCNFLVRPVKRPQASHRSAGMQRGQDHPSADGPLVRFRPPSLRSSLAASGGFLVPPDRVQLRHGAWCTLQSISATLFTTRFLRLQSIFALCFPDR